MSQPLIVLTGAAGGLGTTVHRALLEAGKNVRATDRVLPVSPTQNLVRADLLYSRACRRILQDAKVLVHLAYRQEPRENPDRYPPRNFDEHIRLNRQVFLSACEAGVKKIIFSSSIQVIASHLPWPCPGRLPDYLPLDENSPPQPDNWYSLAKRCSEEMLGMLHRQYGVDCVSLRFPALVHTVPIAHPEWHQGQPSQGFGYLSQRDAASLILKLIDADLPGCRIYVPASRKNLLGSPLPEIIRDHYAGIPLRKPAAELESLVDISTLSRDTGWEPLELSQPEVPPSAPPIRRFYQRIAKRARNR
jgi:nucleoside-diphosphate-sugar epimerase